MSEMMLDIPYELERVIRLCRAGDSLDGKQYTALRIAIENERKIASGEYAPVVHGRWIHKDCDGAPTENHEAIVYAECSNCGHTIHNVDREAEHCPRCGAVLNGKDDSHDQN